MEENTVLSLIQILHNLGGILFAAGPLYVLILIRKRKQCPEKFDLWTDRTIEDTFAILPPMWIVLLVIQIISGAGFGLASLLIHGEFPAMNAVAATAITVKVIGVAIALIISFYMWRVMLPAFRQIQDEFANNDSESQAALDRLQSLRRKREALIVLLVLVALVILTGAAFLRWNM